MELLKVAPILVIVEFRYLFRLGMLTDDECYLYAYVLSGDTIAGGSDGSDSADLGFSDASDGPCGSS